MPRVVAKDYPTFLHQKLPVLFDLHTGRLALAMVPRDSLEIKLLREKMEQLLVDNDPVGHTNNRMTPIDNLVLIFPVRFDLQHLTEQDRDLKLLLLDSEKMRILMNRPTYLFDQLATLQYSQWL